MFFANTLVHAFIFQQRGFPQNMQVCFPAWLVVLRMNIINLVHVMTVTLLYALETFPLQIPAAGISTTAHIWTSGKSDTFMVN